MNEDQMREAFEAACLAKFVARRMTGVPMVDDNGSPASHEALFWRKPNGDYGVEAFNQAWWGWQQGAAHVRDAYRWAQL